MGKDVLTILRELVEIPSPFFYEDAIAEYLAEYLEELGFSVTRQGVLRRAVVEGGVREFEHFNVLGEKGTGGLSFLLYAHMDTVPVVNAWKDLGMDPYVPVLRDGKLYGLGASDMKAGIAAILKALEEIGPEVYDRCRIKVAFGVDEENDSMGAVKLLESGFIDNCIGCIVPEVGSGTAVPSDNNLVVGRHGRIRVGVRVTGRAAHASTPEYIVNPIEYAFRIIEEVKKFHLGDDPEMPPPNLSIAGIHAESWGLSSPEECVIWFDALISVPETTAGVMRQFEELCFRFNEEFRGDAGSEPGIPRFEIIDVRNLGGRDRERYTARTTPFNEPWKIDRNHPLVECASEVIREVSGKDAILSCGKSNADENYLGQVVPTIVVPPVGGNEHQGGEYVEVDSLERVVSVIVGVVERYSKLSAIY